MNFCRRCSAPLRQSDAHSYTCSNGHAVFANSSPTVGIFFLTDTGDVLLSERGIEPRKGMLDSFGGFVDHEESFEHAAQRELHEELGLTPQDYEPLSYLCSGVGHYPYQGETIPILSCFYWTRLKPDVTPRPADDVAAIRQIPLHAVDFAELHDTDIREGVAALQTLFPQG